jgi:hypothetical protein
LPTLTYAAAEGGDELLARLEWTTEEELGICLDYEEILEHGVDGYSSGGRIVVRTSLSPTAKAGVLLHELVHLCRIGIYVVMSVLERASRRGTVFNHHIIGQGEAEPGGNDVTSIRKPPVAL